MEKLVSFAIFIALVSSLTFVRSEEGWAKKLGVQKDSAVTNLQFYLHDTLSGSNPSAMRVAEATITKTSQTQFGSLMMADDPLTVGPEPTSKLIGRAQGMYGSAGQSDVGLIMALSYNFLEGEYKGSSISINGFNPALQEDRELPVVGGTGVFRMSRANMFHSVNSPLPYLSLSIEVTVQMSRIWRKM
ncbi:Dirigent protein [Dillenia turbinata]|uniref:Dirigent protein n=1 Tax=Dillenia turbinata TaxID=194707 RepID=A0AAN8W521_9MAGN